MIHKYKEFLEKLIHKSNIGSGRRNTAFNFIKSKGKVIKVGDDIQVHAKVFKERPDIFPIVYKVSKDYIIIEKLDTIDIMDEFYEMLNIYNIKENKNIIKLNSHWLSNILESPKYYSDTKYLDIINRINYITSEV